MSKHRDGGMYGGFFDTLRTDTYGAGVIASPICTFYTGDNLFFDEVEYKGNSGKPKDPVKCAWKATA